MPNWNDLSETQKEVLHRLQDGETVYQYDGTFKGVPRGVWWVLENEGWIEITLRPWRDEETFEVLPNWRENHQYNHVIRRLLPVGEPDISKDDLALLKTLSEKYGKKRIARLAECQAWIGREKDDERRADAERLMAWASQLKRETDEILK